MSSSICCRCLSELRLSSQRSSLLLPRQSSSSFHTTPVRHANPPKKVPSRKGSIGPKHRESRSATIRKKGVREKAKPPAIGERKALRKRIVVSNTNALEVHDMQDLSPTNIADGRMEGKVLGIPGPMIDQLRAVEAFKTTQGWNMFRRPGFLVRKETVELGRYFEKKQTENRESQEVVRKLITGEQATGKSLHLMQAMSMAFLNDWIVITIPESKSNIRRSLFFHPAILTMFLFAAQDWVNNTSSYAPLPGSTPQQYSQPHLTAGLLSRLSKTKNQFLQRTAISHDYSKFPTKLRRDTSLQALADIGASEPDLAYPIWQALWRELIAPGLPGEKTPPILITIDGLAHWMHQSTYRSPEYEPIHAHNLAIVRQFTDMLLDQASVPKFPSGGMILGATSGSNNPTVYSFEVALRQLKARKAGVPVDSPDFPLPEPYRKVDESVMRLSQADGLELQELKGITKDEARGLLEYFAKSGIIQDKVSEAFVAEKWSMAAGGVIGEVIKFGKRIRLS